MKTPNTVDDARLPDAVRLVLAEIREEARELEGAADDASSLLMSWNDRIVAALTAAGAGGEAVATVCLVGERYANGHCIELQVQTEPGEQFAIGDKLYRK